MTTQEKENFLADHGVSIQIKSMIELFNENAYAQAVDREYQNFLKYPLYLD